MATARYTSSSCPGGTAPSGIVRVTPALGRLSTAPADVTETGHYTVVKVGRATLALLNLRNVLAEKISKTPFIFIGTVALRPHLYLFSLVE